MIIGAMTTVEQYNLTPDDKSVGSDHYNEESSEQGYEEDDHGFQDDMDEAFQDGIDATRPGTMGIKHLSKVRRASYEVPVDSGQIHTMTQDPTYSHKTKA